MARYWIELILLIWINLCIILTIADDNTVDILPSSSLDSLDNDEIIRVLTNDNESVTENFTSELLLNELKNTVQKFWSTSVILKADKSNLYYGLCYFFFLNIYIFQRIINCINKYKQKSLAYSISFILLYN